MRLLTENMCLGPRIHFYVEIIIFIEHLGAKPFAYTISFNSNNTDIFPVDKPILKIGSKLYLMTSRARVFADSKAMLVDITLPPGLPGWDQHARTIPIISGFAFSSVTLS